MQVFAVFKKFFFLRPLLTYHAIVKTCKLSHKNVITLDPRSFPRNLNQNRTESRSLGDQKRAYCSVSFDIKPSLEFSALFMLLSILRVLPVIWSQIEKGYKFSQNTSTFTRLLSVTLDQLSWLAQFFIWNLTWRSEHVQIWCSKVSNSLFLRWNWSDA